MLYIDMTGTLYPHFLIARIYFWLRISVSCLFALGETGRNIMAHLV